jgi:hypothetical protein
MLHHKKFALNVEKVDFFHESANMVHGWFARTPTKTFVISREMVIDLFNIKQYLQLGV